MTAARNVWGSPKPSLSGGSATPYHENRCRPRGRDFGLLRGCLPVRVRKTGAADGEYRTPREQCFGGEVFFAPDPQQFSRQNLHCRAGRPPRIMKTGAGRAGGTSGFYGVAYRSGSARRAPQMASIGRLGSSALAGRFFLRPIPNNFHGKHRQPDRHHSDKARGSTKNFP